jgi:uncharacterized iron-regulated membrane protein
MTDITRAATSGADDTAANSVLYRTFWRWHFYAGLLVLPFLVLLAITGGLYLFKDEVNGLVYGNLLTVEPRGEAMLPSTAVAKATEVFPGTPYNYGPPASPTDSAVVGVETAEGERLSVYVDPHTGMVLGSLGDAGSARSPLMNIVRKVHSLDYFGWVTNRVIETVGGWALLLVVTGTFLWWPRGRNAGTFTVRTKGPRRLFWRDLHAVTGAYAGIAVFFLAISGLPWSGFWGVKLNTYADAWGLGYPPEFWNEVPVSAVPMQQSMTHTSWSFELLPMPVSTPTAAEPIGLDQAVAIFDDLGIHRGYVIDLPAGETGVYSASVFPDRVADERVIHLDQYSGAVLFDGGYADLGPVGTAIEWGISVHMGQEFGVVNQLAMAAACLAILTMAVAAVMMWWKRRPVGKVGAPANPADPRALRALLFIIVPFAVIFPLVGLSLIVALVLDGLVIRRIPALRSAFG